MKDNSFFMTSFMDVPKAESGKGRGVSWRKACFLKWWQRLARKICRENFLILPYLYRVFIQILCTVARFCLGHTVLFNRWYNSLVLLNCKKKLSVVAKTSPFMLRLQLRNLFEPQLHLVLLIGIAFCALGDRNHSDLFVKISFGKW